MSEQDPSIGEHNHPFNWGTNYDTAEGKNKIAARQAVYWCLEPGVQPPDYDLEIIAGLQHAELSPLSTIVDIGCSFPGGFLKLCGLTGLRARLIGIDPYAKQFSGLPYLEPQGSREEFQALLCEGDDARLAQFFKQVGEPAADEFKNITLYQAGADFIPLPDCSVDAVTTIFSGYHAFQNHEALAEVKRILKRPSPMGAKTERAGIHADANSGNENKEGMIEDEGRVAEVLSVITGCKISPPPPLQAGFTSEDTLETFPGMYRHVYVKRIEQEIVFNVGREIVLSAHRTYRDSYMVEDSSLPEKYRDVSYDDKPVVNERTFERALETVVSGQIDDAEEAGEVITDKVRRTIIFASDDEIDLPRGKDGYEQITE